MRFGRLILFSVLLSSVVLPQSEDAVEKKHHYGKRIKAVQDEADTLRKDLDNAEVRIQKLENKLDITDAADMKQMRDRVGKHDLYFEMLTAITAILVVAIMGEVIKRWMSNT